MENLSKKQKIIFSGMAIIMLVTIGYYFFSGGLQLSSPEIEEIETMEEVQTIEEEKKIIVHVTGCVEKEGIVELKEGARIADAIEESGGATLDADMSKINLAYKLKDGQKIYIPSNIEDEEITTVTEKGEGVLEGANGKSGGKININTATQTELETLTRYRPIYGLKNNRISQKKWRI